MQRGTSHITRVLSSFLVVLVLLQAKAVLGQEPPSVVRHFIEESPRMDFESARTALIEARKVLPDARYESVLDSAMIAQFERWQTEQSNRETHRMIGTEIWIHFRHHNYGTAISRASTGLNREDCTAEDSLGYFSHIWRSYGNLGDTQRAFAWYDKYITMMKKLDRLPPHFHPEDEFPSIYGMLGLHERALYYARRKRTRDLARDPAGESSESALNNMGVHFMRAEVYDSALHYFELAHAAMIRRIEAEQLVPEDQMYQFQYFILGNIGDVYLAQGKFADAIPLLTEDLERSQSAYRPSDNANVSLGLAEAYLGLGDPDSAWPHLHRATQHYQDIHNEKRLLDCKRQWAEYHYHKQDLEAYRNEITAIAESEARISETARSERLDALLATRELDAKEVQLVQQRAQMKADEAQLRGVKVQRNFTVAVAILIGLLMVAGVVWAVRERRQKEVIEQAVQDKEVLLSEIHHRVKNNLQIVSGLLQMQGDKLEDAQAQEALRDSESRVRAMAMISDKLYAKEVSSVVAFEPYLRGLVESIAVSYARTDKPIAVEVNCPPVTFSLDTSVPLGLIVNELVTNAFKHAFEGRHNGRIEVNLKPTAIGYQLQVFDNGVGLQKDLDNLSEKHIGVELIRGLSQQLKGNMEVISTSEGTRFTVAFKGSEKKSIGR